MRISTVKKLCLFRFGILSFLFVEGGERGNEEQEEREEEE